jgi:glycosyltransferase involved in cell wall biosynthesis
MRRDERILVVHLITGLGTGGAELMLARLASRADRRRFRFIVVSLLENGAVADQIHAAGVEVRSLNLRRARDLPFVLARLEHLLLSSRPQVLQTWLYHADLVGLFAGIATAVPRILWNVRSTVLPHGPINSFSDLLPRILARLSPLPAAVVVNSESGRKAHEEYGYKCRDWRVIPNGFDTAVFKPVPGAREAARASLGVPANAMVVGMLARFHQHKDHDTFLRAASLTRRTIGNVRFVLAGSGTDEPELAALVARYGLQDCVHLLGERRDVPGVLSGLDLATLSSWTEGFPNAIGEAMSCSVPCVGTDVGDSALLLGSTGIVVAPRDPTALSDAWLRLLLADEQARRELGAKARERIIRHFDLTRAVATYEDLYEEMCARPAPPMASARPRPETT